MARREVAGRRLGELEADVMELAWDRGDWIGVNELLAALHGQQRAYTTVMTIVTRLCDKGLLERRREGRGFVYRPTLSKEELAARTLREVLAGADDPRAVLAHFVKDLEASPELLARLRMLGDGSGADPEGKADRG